MNRHSWIYFVLMTLSAILPLMPATIRAASYDLQSVNGIQAFSGSEDAKALLTKNGFVVADPTFKQIFQAYIESPQLQEPSETNPMGVSLPSFITPDSAWDTYHVLLEEGVKEMETVQAQTLLKFSQQLLATAREQRADNDLLLFASVGLALQDEQHRQTLASEEKRIVDALRNGSDDVPVPIGFPLSPAQFRAQSFYTQSPQLSDYFAARQWYASVVFRLVDARETRLAVALARLVNGNPQLLALWKQLSEPFDTFLATAEDASVSQYSDAAASVQGTATTPVSDAQLTEIQKKLENDLPFPRVNDQMMTLEQFLAFPKFTRGFRLLPPRRLPCAMCFQDTVYPKIPNRYIPSGLDFLAASPVLRSPASVRALQSEFGKNVSDLILKTDCGPMPDSLHGQAMQLLAKLQQPLPSDVPAPLRSEAWQDLQLWTQLGAWAEQRHTWALHTKMNVEVLGIVSPPKGMVAPYPDFFAGLAALTRRTAEALQQAGLNQQFDVKTVSDRLLGILRSRKNATSIVIDLENSSSDSMQFGAFESRYYELHPSERQKDSARFGFKHMEDDLEALAERGSTGQATSTDVEALRLFFDCRQDTVRLINDFAPVCDRLAELAKKSLHGKPLTDEDAKWIENYGITLAGFHFYYGNSYEVPRDDFPIVTRVFYDPVGGKMFYAGLARPQALYVVVPNGKSLQLYRGAVMTYREFVHSDKDLLDDDGWRAMVAKGSIPPAPPFTKTFYAETSVAELLKQLLPGKVSQESEEDDYQNVEDLFWQLGARATEKDVPQLIEAFTRAEGHRSGLADGLAEIIMRLSWKSHENQLMNLLASPDYVQANAAARIFVRQPASIDSDAFTTHFAKQPVRARRFYCAIVSELPQQSTATKQMLLQALRDSADGVRWQAALAIGRARWNDDQSRTALLEALNDKNEMVAAAAVHALIKLGVTNAAPMLLKKLEVQAQLPVRVSEEPSPQANAVLVDFQHGQYQPGSPLLGVDGLEWRMQEGVTRIMQQRANLRTPPLPIDLAMHNYCLADELIEALGDFGYAPAIDELMKLRATDYDAEATIALNKMAPDRLADDFLKTALDRQVDSYLREKALVALSKGSATNRVRELIPLLDDTTVINYSRPMPLGIEMRICDRAAETIAVMLGWEDRRFRQPLVPPRQREDLMARVRDWAKDNAANK